MWTMNSLSFLLYSSSFSLAPVFLSSCCKAFDLKPCFLMNIGSSSLKEEQKAGTRVISFFCLQVDSSKVSSLESTLLGLLHGDPLLARALGTLLRSLPWIWMRFLRKSPSQHEHCLKTISPNCFCHLSAISKLGHLLKVQTCRCSPLI